MCTNLWRKWLLSFNLGRDTAVTVYFQIQFVELPHVDQMENVLQYQQEDFIVDVMQTTLATCVIVSF